MTEEEMNSKANYIVEEIVEDASGRCGIGNALDDIDEDIKEEMFSEWKTKILRVLKGR